MTDTPLIRLLVTGWLLAAVGCASTKSGGGSSGTRTIRDDDPLLGGAGALPPPPPPPVNSMSPPALTKASPTSTAALAGGAFRPLTGGSELRIGGGDLAEPPGQSVKEPTPVPVPRPTGLPEAIEPPGRSGSGQLEQAMAEVERYHPRWTRLEQVDGKWRFSCSIPDRQAASASRTFTAEGATPADAVRTGLERLRKEQ